jgi:hypothetical protein
MEEYILRNKKEADSRKKPIAERSRWQKEAATAHKDKKNGKSRKAAAATNFPLLLHAAAKTPKTAIKGEALSTPRPSRSTAQSIHLTSRSTAQTNHPSLHHPSPIAPPKTFTFSTHLSLYSSAATRTDRRLNKNTMNTTKNPSKKLKMNKARRI